MDDAFEEKESIMKVYRRICIRDYSVSDEEGNTATVKKGKEYLTSEVGDAPCIGPSPVKGHVIVFSDFWFPVPIHIFRERLEFTTA